MYEPQVSLDLRILRNTRFINENLKLFLILHRPDIFEVKSRESNQNYW